MRTLLCFFFLTSTLFAIQNSGDRQIVDLRGTWKFELGDNRKYAERTYDDGKWDEIFVPANWENEGYPGYDGYAWYRKSFTVPANTRAKRLVFNLGFVDDVCAVYVNGTLIGEGGRFEPDFQTAYDQEQRYILPADLLEPGKENVVAVRVYDAMQGGGIIRGRIGIAEEQTDVKYVVQLPVRWKFCIGDDEAWKDPNFNDKAWRDLIVPAKWDFQGFRDYDGYAWYRVTFDLPAGTDKQGLVLMLGKIDDIDETYVNGERIGRTGRLRRDGSISTQNDYQKLRGYDIPAALLKEKGNVIAVRVYDGLKDGGIYEGPVGIVTEKEFDHIDRKTGQNRFVPNNNFNRFLEKLFPDY